MCTLITKKKVISYIVHKGFAANDQFMLEIKFINYSTVDTKMDMKFHVIYKSIVDDTHQWKDYLLIYRQEIDKRGHKSLRNVVHRRGGSWLTGGGLYTSMPTVFLGERPYSGSVGHILLGGKDRRRDQLEIEGG